VGREFLFAQNVARMQAVEHAMGSEYMKSVKIGSADRHPAVLGRRSCSPGGCWAPTSSRTFVKSRVELKE
jgi:hypothetical protein